MSTNPAIVEFPCSSSKEIEEHLTSTVVAAEQRHMQPELGV